MSMFVDNSPKNSDSSFKRRAVFPGQWIVFGSIWYGALSWLRRIRVSKTVTSVLGPQYKRSRNYIEIDITYLCNLRCNNCNRSCSQAPEALHISLELVQNFVDESIKIAHRWDRIRILGGEPTLHPQFLEIMDQLIRYRQWNPLCRIEVVTNGYGGEVQSNLACLPKDIWVENSKKKGRIQPEFGPFNLAPCDDTRFNNSDFRNGCAIMRDCGMGLTPLGYYPCAVAGGIDRIADFALGFKQLPHDDDEMEELLTPFCSLCGRFRDGHFVPKNLRPKLLEAKVSITWKRLYIEWSEKMENNIWNKTKI